VGPHQKKFDTTAGGDIEEHAEMRSDAEATRVSLAMAVDDQKIRLNGEPLEGGERTEIS
jgi:hypothetical protein